MRIYKVNIEHIRYGNNWSSKNVHAKNFEELLRKSKKFLRVGERIESVELLASTN